MTYKKLTTSTRNAVACYYSKVGGGGERGLPHIAQGRAAGQGMGFAPFRPDQGIILRD